MVAMLLGTFMLGACVDNDESASVEAVRTAKAEQLKSVAAMNNAEAEAKKLLAEADAALKNAEAEAQKIRNDGDKAQLAITMAGQDQKLEAALLQAQAALAQAKTALEDALKTADEATRVRIIGLATNYSNAVIALNGFKSDLVTEQKRLLGLEYGLVSVESVIADDIAFQEAIITKNTKEIEVYNTYGGKDVAELKAAKEASDMQALSLSNKSTAEREAGAIATDAYTKAKTAYDNSEYVKTAGKAGFSSCVTTQIANEKIEYTYSDGVDASAIPYSKYSYMVVDAKGLEIQTASLTADVTSAKTALESAKTTNDAAEKATNDAFKAWQDAAAGDKVAKLNAYNTAKNASDASLGVMNAAQQNLDAADKKLKEWKDGVALLTDTGVAGHKALTDALNKASKGVAESGKATSLVSHDQGIEQAKNTALGGLVNGAIDTKAKIASCQENIDDAKLEITRIKTFDKADKAALVAESKAKIEVFNAEIQAGEANVKSAKAALDAAMAE